MPVPKQAPGTCHATAPGIVAAWMGIYWLCGCTPSQLQRVNRHRSGVSRQYRAVYASFWTTDVCANQSRRAELFVSRGTSIRKASRRPGGPVACRPTRSVLFERAHPARRVAASCQSDRGGATRALSCYPWTTGRPLLDLPMVLQCHSAVVNSGPVPPVARHSVAFFRGPPRVSFEFKASRRLRPCSQACDNYSSRGGRLVSNFCKFTCSVSNRSLWHSSPCSAAGSGHGKEDNP
jgi:hypothetical protein